MRIVILGANGQLGRQLVKTLPGEIIPLRRDQADLTKSVELRKTLAGMHPNIVVNAAGYTQVDGAETASAEAFAVNALALRDLAAICQDGDSTLIHFSTDYVFGLDAERTSPFSELDLAGPINVYGASKLAGEHFVQSLCPKHFVVRTCGLYGPLQTNSGRNFVTTMLRHAEQRTLLRVVDDQVCTPTSTLDLAHATRELIDSERFGLYHITNAGACSWYEFTKRIFAVAKKAMSVVPIKSAEYAAPAARPRYSVLSNAKWIASGFTPLRTWQEALASYLASRNA